MNTKTSMITKILNAVAGAIVSPTDEERSAAHTAAALAARKEIAENVLKRTDEFDYDFLELYISDPFLGGVSLDITKIVDQACPTAYVGVRKNGARSEVVLGFSPKFVRELSREERKGVFCHELYHVIFGHIFHRSVAKSADQMMWNWATDLAINSIIGANRLPNICLIPGVHPLEKQKDGTMKPAENKYAKFIATAKPLQASDYYYDELKKIRDSEGDSDESMQVVFDAMGTMDSHDGWNDLDPETAEELRDKMKDLIGRAAGRADKSNQWGSVPQHIQELIRKMLSHEVDWRSIIRNFIGRARSVDRATTIRRINKRMPYVFPGCRRPMIANFACFMDQSGSMSDEDIALLFGELGSLANLTKLDVYHFDTEIDENSHKIWKKGDANPQCLRTRCGGTDFQSVANFLNDPKNKNKWSGAIILTDGYAPTMGTVSGCKILWVITPGGSTDALRHGDLVCRMTVDSGKFKSI